MLTPGTATFTASETIPAGARVKLVSGSATRIELADSTDTEIGTAILYSGKSSYAADESVGVKLLNDPGTRTCIADAGDITLGETVYRANDGKVADSGTEIFGFALEASADANDNIEVLHVPGLLEVTPADGSVTTAKIAANAVTAAKLESPITPVGIKRVIVVDDNGATLTVAQSNAVVSNAGAVGAATFILPAAVAGLEYVFVVEAAQELRIDPDGTETIALPSTGVQGAAGKYLTADAVGEKVHIVCITAGTWDVIHYSGTWTAES